MSQFTIEWRSAGRKAKNAADPRIPNGIDADVTRGVRPACRAELPYPAPECGIHIVECATCGYTAAITAAGRPDDPRSIKIPCKGASAHG